MKSKNFCAKMTPKQMDAVIQMEMQDREDVIFVTVYKKSDYSDVFTIAE